MHGSFRVGAILLMGGKGERLAQDLPKQFLLLGQKKVYEHALGQLLLSSWIDAIVLSVHSDFVETVRQEHAQEMRIKVVEGGVSRQESSFKGLQGFSQKPDIVLIHDAVRPFVSLKILEDNIEKAILHGACDTCIPSSDTLVFSQNGLTIDAIPPRHQILRGQTPQTFQFDILYKAHLEAKKRGIANASDDCQLVLHLGHKIAICLGEEKNMKITHLHDWAVAESMLSEESTL